MSQINPSPIVIPDNKWRTDALNELHELTRKIIDLRRFMNSEDFFKMSEQNCNLLRKQSAVMCEYADLLTERLRSN